MNLAQFIEKTNNRLVEQYQPRRPRLYLKSGVSMIVLANARAFCKPQENNAAAYTHVQINAVSCGRWPAEFCRYRKYKYSAAGASQYYKHVPVGVVQDYIDSQGGIDESKTMEQQSELFGA